MTNLSALNSMESVSDFGVLIVGYKRSDSLRSILDVCLDVQVKRIYIALDAPKDSETKAKQGEIHKQIEDFRRNFKGEISVLQRNRNVGCAAAVLSAVDWLFESETYGVVIEDDCIPVNDFFKFCAYSFPAIENNSNIWLACGTQLAPVDPLQSADPWLLSNYPLTWGWATTSKKWSEAKASILNLNPQHSLASIIDSSYWRAGALRALKGYTDVWDTVLVLAMLANQKQAILPTDSLIKNVGNDENATHTIGSSNWLHRKTGTFKDPVEVPGYSATATLWLRKNIFMISFRHIFTTRISKIRDLFRMNKQLGPLKNRWDRANDDRKLIAR